MPVCRSGGLAGTRNGMFAPRHRPLAIAMSALLLGGAAVREAAAQAFPASLGAGSISHPLGTRFSGASGERSGSAIAAAGDVNGDNVGDFIIGAPNAAPNGAGSGSSYLVFGRTPPFMNSDDPTQLNGSNGFRIDGAAAGDQSGYSVSSAGDINGDGIDDLAIGAPRVDSNGTDSGAVYVVFGKNTPFAAGIALSTLNGSNGVRFDGASAGDLAGFSVAAAGDINGDGRDDLVVGARFANTNGSSYVVFGRSTPFPATFALSALSGSDGFRLDGGAGINSSGFTVSPAGDINGDGRSDLLIGSTSGAHVVFGRSTAFSATLALSALSGSDGFRIADAGGFSGSAVAAAGDVNGDRIDDVVVAAFGLAPNGSSSGSSFVVFGKTTPFAATLVLTDLDGNNGFRINGAAAQDYSGRVVGAADINGDALGDLIIGAYGADPGASQAGAAYIVYGQRTPFSPSVAVSTLDGSNGFRITGLAFNDQLGRAVTGAGDVTGDGVDDLIVGAPRAGGSAGTSYVLFGNDRIRRDGFE